MIVMHELSLIEGIIRSVEEQKKKHGFLKLSAVEVVCGKYNCIAEDNLQFCFDIATQSSWMKGARLKVRRLPGKSVCARCSFEFDLPRRGKRQCPKCSSEEIADIIDNTVYVENLEVEE